MSPRRPMPCDIEPDCLADLVADARAIPAAAFVRPKRVPQAAIDLTALPTQALADALESRVLS